MPYRKNKFKCQNCDAEVYRKETILCMKCRAIAKTGVPRVDKVAQKERIKAYKREYFQKNKKEIRGKIQEREKINPTPINIKKNYSLKSLYNTSLEEVGAFFIVQKGRCMICEIKFGEGGQRMVIDHDHRRKVVRGLLCHNCNVGLGHFKDNINLLKESIKYLGGTI